MVSASGPVLRIVAVVLLKMGTLATAAVAFGQDAAANRNAAERLQKAVEQDYSHRDRKGVDWGKRFAEFAPQLALAATTNDFTAKTVELLAPAQDIHLWLKVGETIVPTHRVEMRPNFNPRLLPRLIPTLKQHGKTVLVGQFEDGIRYVAIATWDNREPDSTKAAIAAVADAAKAKAQLIIDVRPNTGGDEITARRVASFFVGVPTVYAKHFFRRAGADAELRERVLEANEDGIRHPGPCVVLMGAANFSSCEAFLLMMRAAGCQLIGEKSFGASGNPQPKDLGNGVVAYVPSWRSLDAQGRELEGIGIAPDVKVETKPDDFQRTDLVLVRALEILRSQKK